MLTLASLALLGLFTVAATAEATHHRQDVYIVEFMDPVSFHDLDSFPIMLKTI